MLIQSLAKSASSPFALKNSDHTSTIFSADIVRVCHPIYSTVPGHDYIDFGRGKLSETGSVATVGLALFSGTTA